MSKDKTKEEERQAKMRELEKKLVKELCLLLVRVKQRVDRWLVKTWLGVVMAILLHHHRQRGSWLSELGCYLLEPEHYQAVTKRISNLLHSQKWEAGLIKEYLWQPAKERVEGTSFEPHTCDCRHRCERDQYYPLDRYPILNPIKCQWLRTTSIVTQVRPKPRK